LAADDSFEGRIDYLELLISTLRDHEKQLNAVADTLVASANAIRGAVAEAGPAAPGIPALTVRCERWAEFKRRGAQARLVAFSLREHRLTVHAVADAVYAYAEPLPAQALHVRRDGATYVVDRLAFDRLDQVPLAFRQRLACGLDGTYATSRRAVADDAYRVQLRFTLDPARVRRWLADELQVPPDGIVEGRIAH
jgi:hypothetical protein